MLKRSGESMASPWAKRMKASYRKNAKYNRKFSNYRRQSYTNREGRDGFPHPVLDCQNSTTPPSSNTASLLA